MIKRSYQNLNQITINHQALIHNYAYFKSLRPKSLIAPVLKSNAYGHGLVEIAKVADKYIRPPYICVDSLYEAQVLTKNHIKTPILIIGYTFPENFKSYKKIPYTIPVFDTNTIEILNKYQKNIKVHIKIDSGMNRLGLKIKDIEPFIKVAKNMTNIEFEGIYTHLAQADQKEGNNFTKQQLKTFQEAIKIFRHYGFIFKMTHVGATAGTSRISSSLYNLCRIGLGFYGFSPFPLNSEIGKKQRKVLIPALSLTTHLIQIKSVLKGEQISYSGTFIAPKNMTIGIIPIGYNDGLDRRLSNRGVVMINKTPCPIVGRVCMNITMIDITEITNPLIGQEVIVYSNNPGQLNTIDKSAKLASTISHELLVHLDPTTKRTII